MAAGPGGGEQRAEAAEAAIAPRGSERSRSRDKEDIIETRVNAQEDAAMASHWALISRGARRGVGARSVARWAAGYDDAEELLWMAEGISHIAVPIIGGGAGNHAHAATFNDRAATIIEIMIALLLGSFSDVSLILAHPPTYDGSSQSKR